MLVYYVSAYDSPDYDDRGLHKKKRRPQVQQSGPCGGFRDAGAVADDGRFVCFSIFSMLIKNKSRSFKLVAAAAGAAAGYYLGQKHQQQPVINNIITTGGGYPCGGGGGGGFAPPQHGGLLGGVLGGLGGLKPRDSINWDRTIRQFNRQVVRPLTRWFRK